MSAEVANIDTLTDILTVRIHKLKYNQSRIKLYTHSLVQF